MDGLVVIAGILGALFVYLGFALSGWIGITFWVLVGIAAVWWLLTEYIIERNEVLGIFLLVVGGLLLVGSLGEQIYFGLTDSEPKTEQVIKVKESNSIVDWMTSKPLADINETKEL